MKLTELTKAIRVKTAELKAAQEAGKPQEELSTLYRELKELQYRKVQASLEQAAGTA